MKKRDDFREEIYGVILKTPMTTSQLSAKFGVPSQTISNHLRRLKEQGKATIDGNRHATPYWRGMKVKEMVRNERQDWKKSVNRMELVKAVRGTPWQGLEHFL